MAVAFLQVSQIEVGGDGNVEYRDKEVLKIDTPRVEMEIWEKEGFVLAGFNSQCRIQLPC